MVSQGALVIEQLRIDEGNRKLLMEIVHFHAKRFESTKKINSIVLLPKAAQASSRTYVLEDAVFYHLNLRLRWFLVFFSFDTSGRKAWGVYWSSP